MQVQGPGKESAGRMGHVGSLVGGGAPAAAQGKGSNQCRQEPQPPSPLGTADSKPPGGGSRTDTS